MKEVQGKGFVYGSKQPNVGKFSGLEGPEKW